jgi:hypothetical protein
MLSQKLDFTDSHSEEAESVLSPSSNHLLPPIFTLPPVRNAWSAYTEEGDEYDAESFESLSDDEGNVTRIR